MDHSNLTALKNALFTALSSLTKLIHLRTLTLEFSLGDCIKDPWEEDPSQGLVLQRHILKTVTDNAPPPSLLSFSLLNVCPITNGVYESDSFHHFMGIPKKLTVSVNLGDDISRSCYNCFQQFLEEDFPLHILAPASQSLTSLTLMSGHFGQHFDGPPFDDLFFPHLASLTFFSMLLSYADDFIVRHKATITHLHLEECAMEVDAEEDLPLQTWSAFWTTLQEAPVLLISLVVFPEEGAYVTTSPESEIGYEPLQLTDELPKDEVALQRFWTFVESRAQCVET